MKEFEYFSFRSPKQSSRYQRLLHVVLPKSGFRAPCDRFQNTIPHEATLPKGLRTDSVGRGDTRNPHYKAKGVWMQLKSVPPLPWCGASLVGNSANRVVYSPPPPLLKQKQNIDIFPGCVHPFIQTTIAVVRVSQRDEARSEKRPRAV